MKQSRLQTIVRNSACYALVAPTFALLAVFCLVPFVWAFAASFYRYEIGGEATWIGIANYQEYLSDPTLLPSFYNMFILTFIGVVITIVFPLGTAKLIFSLSSEKARYIYRILFLIPIVVPGVAVMMIWGGMIYSDSGLVNETLRLIGQEDLTRGWLSNPDTVLYAVSCIGFPFASGVNILIYYAGLASIPDSVHEAAQLDGATGFRKFMLIDVPLVLSQIKLMVILTIIGGVQGFQGMFILTRGGPGFRSMVPGLWMYFNAFSFQRMGYACAIGVFLFVIILALTIVNLKYFKSSEDLQAAK
ncbi:MAG TPA: sugar ABC transporter permease [Candidatus Brocadiia bacterium]|nr:sugar ABC transporter permease [Candidatus Brocadiia bacterium]